MITDEQGVEWLRSRLRPERYEIVKKWVSRDAGFKLPRKWDKELLLGAVVVFVGRDAWPEIYPYLERLWQFAQ